MLQEPAANPYLQRVLTGRFQSALPWSWRAENYTAIRDNLDALEWHCASVESVLAKLPDGSVNGCNLSDIFEYMSQDGYEGLLRDLARVGAPGCRLVYWNVVVPRSRPGTLAGTIKSLADYAKKLHTKGQGVFLSRPGDRGGALMESSLLAIVLPPLTLVPVMGLLSRAKSNNAVQAELRRKALHVSIGFMSLFLPLVLTETWLIIAASLLAFGWMLSVRHVACIRSRFGRVLHDADRRSHGELYFTLSIGLLLFLATDEPLLYIAPILILSIADAAAALVGKAFPMGRLGGPARGKTLSGCAAFFLGRFRD